MTVAITRAEVLKIADLARLRFTESELDAFIVQFQRILDYVEQLKQVAAEPRRSLKELIEDAIRASLARRLLNSALP